MKIGVYTDVHYCSSASLIRMRGKKFSARLENCIQSVNWAEHYFTNMNCDRIVCLGDFFDKNILNAEEITALNYLNFNTDIPHHFIVGNHEMSKHDCSDSTAEVFRNYRNFYVYNQPIIMNKNILFLPYIPESDKKSLVEYCNHPDIIFSHNDIAGIRYGAIINETGFNIKEIEDNCKLFINGHLHNGQFINEKETILNLGNLTGINFSEDATTYDHYACVVDTDTLEVQFAINPYAYNFYKIDFDPSVNYQFKGNSVVTLRVKESDVEKAKELLYNNSDKIVTTRMITLADNNQIIEDIQFDAVDYLATFKNFMLSKLEQTSVLTEELNELIGGR